MASQLEAKELRFSRLTPGTHRRYNKSTYFTIFYVFQAVSLPFESNDHLSEFLELFSMMSTFLLRRAVHKFPRQDTTPFTSRTISTLQNNSHIVRRLTLSNMGNLIGGKSTFTLLPNATPQPTFSPSYPPLLQTHPLLSARHHPYHPLPTPSKKTKISSASSSLWSANMPPPILSSNPKLKPMPLRLAPPWAPAASSFRNSSSNVTPGDPKAI